MKKVVRKKRVLPSPKKAKFISEQVSQTGAIQRLYRLSEPLEGNRYVLVSAVVAMFSGPETFIFGSDRRGEVKNWLELDGSYQGGLDHEEALRNAGYDAR